MFNKNYPKHIKFLCKAFNKFLYIIKTPNKAFKNEFCNNNCNILSCKFNNLKKL